jgi:hypothetical protein
MPAPSEPTIQPGAPADSEIPPGQAAPTVTEGGRLQPALAVLAPLLFLAVALAALRPGLFTGHDTIVGTTGDPSFSIWALQWMPFALSHHLNPLFTDYLHYPTGANMMWNGSILFPALVLMPVTVLAGPIVSYNVLTLLSMWLSGWCAFLAIRRFSRRWVAAAVGGLLYEFSPFMASQIIVHSQLFPAMFPPLLLIFADEILVRQRRRPWLIGGLLGVATAAQLLTGTELLAISALLSIPALITLAIIFRAQLRERLGYALRAAEAALVAFAVLAGYPIYFLLLGPQRIYGTIQGDVYMARPQAFVIPSKLQFLGGPSAISDSSVYIGIPLLVLLIAVTVWMRRRPAVVAAAVTVACTMVLALGDFLTIGATSTDIRLPWRIATKLPVLSNVLPVRLMVVAYLALAVIVAIFLDRVLEAPRWKRVGGLAVVAVALIPLIPTLPIESSQLDVPAFFTDGQAQRLPQTGSVLMTPYGVYVPDYPPELWEAVSDMAFKTQLGIVYTPGPGGNMVGPEMDPLGKELNTLGKPGQKAPAVLSPSVRTTYLSDLRAQGVTTVIVGPALGSAQEAQLMTEVLGRSGISTGGVVVWYGVPAVDG